jgi:hypothetical protein
MRLYGCALLRHTLGSRAAPLPFYSATRIYRPPLSLRDRCRMRQNTLLSFRSARDAYPYARMHVRVVVACTRFPSGLAAVL